MQLSTQRELWGKLTTWSARICATRIYTLDGGWREVETENGGKTRIATRAAIDHEGHILGGRIFEADVKADNYIAELAAQLDALTDAVGRGSGERVIVVFDATSPVRAMLRFGRLSARARGDRLAAELLEHFERLRRRVAVLVLLWQTSHVGEPLNEWADVACDTFGLEDDYPIPRGIAEFASMTFPSHRGSAQEYVMQGMRRAVAARLRSRVSGTVLRDNTEHVQLLGVTTETQQLCDEIATRRCQYVDQPYANKMVRRLLQAEWCPFGCRTRRDGWREIHASAGARRRVVINPRLAALLRTRLGGQLGEVCAVSEQEEFEHGGAEVRSGDAIRDGERWFTRAECVPTWWHFHFECEGDPLVAVRKAYALQAVDARRRMVNSQVGKELVPHSQLDDLILLIHQGLLGWVAEDGAAGSLAQKQYIQNCIQRGVHDAWETEHWRAAAAGRIRVSGSRADSNGPWRLALTEMVVRGCRQQQLGKEHCKSGREAFWARVRDIRLMSKIFHDMLHTTRQATVRRRAALRHLRLAREYVVSLGGLDGYAKRRLRAAVQAQQAETQEEQTANGPGEWLMLRVWLAWRLVLAQGRGNSGRSILHGGGRAHLREHLLRAALGDTRELQTTGVRIAELCLLQKHVWRRWLTLGGWGAFHLRSLRLTRAKRSRALAEQRESMRRWAMRADGLCWQLLTTQEVEERFELNHEGLRDLLTRKQILSAGEWRKLGINNLRVGHYVRVRQGTTEAFYGPAEVASQHTLSGRVAEDIGDLLEIEIAPRWNPQRGKRRRQDVLRGRREVRQKIAMGPVRDGIEADDGGRWAVRSIRAVRRHESRRGRPLDVLVEWEGEDSDGDLWEESWVSVTYLTADLRAEARKLEAELFGPRATQAGPTSRRANHREDARRRQERERDVQQWRARLRDRAPPPFVA